jgi:hypothetical protein
MEKPLIPGLRAAIVEALYQVSANILADVCEGFGLAAGTREEAFSSKQRYVSKRLVTLSREALLDLARQVLEEYPTENLKRIVRSATQTLPADTIVSATLAFDEESVHALWQKALSRRDSDPAGAITIARTLLEEVCKHVIANAGQSYNEKDELPKLYRTAAECLNLAPDQHTEDIFRRILGGCQTIVEGLGAIRNRLSDAHGQGPKPARPTGRHATLAVNLAGAMAMFLDATWAERNVPDG